MSVELHSSALNNLLLALALILKFDSDVVLYPLRHDLLALLLLPDELADAGHVFSWSHCRIGLVDVVEVLWVW